VRAGNSIRPAGERKRRSHDLTEDSSAADPPHPSVLLTPSEKATRVATLKNARISKAHTFHARVREQGGSRS